MRNYELKGGFSALACVVTECLLDLTTEGFIAAEHGQEIMPAKFEDVHRCETTDRRGPWRTV